MTKLLTLPDEISTSQLYYFPLSTFTTSFGSISDNQEAECGNVFFLPMYSVAGWFSSEHLVYIYVHYFVHCFGCLY
jgi:hypothetical protein